MKRIDAIKAVLASHVPRFAEELALLYKALGWKWHDGVPNEDHINSTLTMLIGNLRDKPDECHRGTGGLVVGYETGEHGIELFMRFEHERRFWTLGKYLND